MNASMVVKDIIMQAVARYVAEEMRKGGTYHMIGTIPNMKQRDDPEAFREMQPMIVVLVKHSSCAMWHAIEKQIKDAINEAGKGTEMLSFGSSLLLRIDQKMREALL